MYPDSPAAAAGLRQGDLILSVDGTKIANTSTLQDVINAKSVGQTLTLQVTRQGRPRAVTVTLRERPSAFGQERQQPQQAPQGDDQQGNPFLP